MARDRVRLPLSPSRRLKWDALSEQLDLRVVASAARDTEGGDARFRLVRPLPLLDGPLFWLRLPFALRRELRDFRPDAIVAQSPYEGAAALLVRPRARVIVEVHGDWRTATRLYGSRARRALNGLADRVSARAVRRADAVRTVSTYTSDLVAELGVDPAATFPAFMDLEPFLGPSRPLPAGQDVLFVGVLERYKNFDGLCRAWRLAAPRVPGARLRIVGKGSMEPLARELVAELPAQTEWTRELATAEVAAALDESVLLLLPSRSEGMGRVLVEALSRGRPVLAAGVGGIRDLVHPGENGVLVEPEPQAIADALVALLEDRGQLERLAAAARASVDPWLATPDEYAGRVRALVEKTATRAVN